MCYKVKMLELKAICSNLINNFKFKILNVFRVAIKTLVWL